MSSVASGRLHRSSRSGRCLGAAGLVALAVVLTAISLTTGRALGAVAVLDVVAAIGVGTLLHSEIMGLRRQVASERAGAAVRAAAKARGQADEHVILMNTLTSTMRFHQAAAAHLGTRVHMLEVQLATAQAELAALRDAEWLSSETRVSGLRVVS
jgi:uncharacterized protein HemX